MKKQQTVEKKNVTLFLNNDEVQLLDLLAKKEQRTRSSLMRKLLLDSLKKEYSEYIPDQTDLFNMS